MENLVFMLWMVLYPLSTTVGYTISYKWGEGKGYSVEAKGMAALVEISVYIYVGSLLYVG